MGIPRLPAVRAGAVLLCLPGLALPGQKIVAVADIHRARRLGPHLQHRLLLMQLWHDAGFHVVGVQEARHPTSSTQPAPGKHHLSIALRTFY